MQGDEARSINDSDHRHIKDDEFDTDGVLIDSSAGTETLEALRAGDAPIAICLLGFERDDGAGIVGLHDVEALAFGVEGVGEDDGLGEFEDLGVGGDALDGVVAGGVGVVGRLDAFGLREGRREDVVDEVEADGGADARFGVDEEGYPEGEHAGDEIDERCLPVVVEDFGW